jgi:hypothetical protein
MSKQHQDLDELIIRLEASERAGWRSSLLWTVVPALLAFAFLGYASLRLADANKEVSVLQEQADNQRAEVELLHGEAASLRKQAEQARTETERLQIEVAESTAKFEAMQTEISTLRKQLHETLELSRFEHPVDMVDMKMFYSRYPKAARMLDKILDLRNSGVGWRLGGETPEQGFDSPGFAAYVLQEFDLLPREEDESLLHASRQLATRLKSTSDPQVGDIVLYPAGYVLFRFEDRDRKPYVIGMSPSGIVALKPDFAKVIGYRKIP